MGTRLLKVTVILLCCINAAMWEFYTESTLMALFWAATALAFAREGCAMAVAARENATSEKANAEHPSQTWLQRAGEIAHEPKSHSAKIAAAESGHEEHDDGGEKGCTDDASKQQGCAVNLTLAATEEIDCRDGGCGAEGCAERSKDGSEPDGERQVRLRYKSEDGAERGAARHAEHVWIGEGIAEQGLKARASNGKRCTDHDRQENAGQANFDNDHAVVAG